MSWKCQRRLAARIEATPQGLDIRYVVTNLAGGSAEWLYETLYCARGHQAARISETATRIRVAFAAACPQADLFSGPVRDFGPAGP